MRKPARQLPIRVGGLAAREGVGRDRPAVARAPNRLRHPFASDQTGAVQTLEMDPHAAGMKSQLRRKLVGPRGVAKTSQVGEQPRARRLSQHVTPTVGTTRSHARQFLTEPFSKVPAMVFS